MTALRSPLFGQLLARDRVAPPALDACLVLRFPRGVEVGVEGVEEGHARGRRRAVKSYYSARPLSARQLPRSRGMTRASAGRPLHVASAHHVDVEVVDRLSRVAAGV